MRTTPARLTAVVLALVLFAAACGSSKSSNDSDATKAGAGTTLATGGVDSALAAKLPEKIKSAGKIIVATDASYAPNEFYKDDGTTLQGMDIDMAKAIGKVLGVEVEVENASFDTIIPSLGTRYDIGMSSFTDSLEREQVVDMVTYFQAGTSFLVQTGKNSDLSSLDALCGHSVGVEKGTTQLDDATAQSTTCTDGRQGRGRRADVRGPDRRQPGPEHRPGRRRHARHARRRVPGQAVERHLRGGRLVLRRGALRCGRAQVQPTTPG